MKGDQVRKLPLNLSNNVTFNTLLLLIKSDLFQFQNKKIHKQKCQTFEFSAFPMMSRFSFSYVN